AYNRRTVKKRAAAAGRFRFIERMAQAARLCEQPIIEEPLKNGLRQQAVLGSSKEWLKLRDYASSL
ncbi:MAG: hypothetical protein SOZ96_14085, partial [Treponema sp.]|nr:hypothetical protein [Treponema sp.]